MEVSKKTVYTVKLQNLGCVLEGNDFEIGKLGYNVIMWMISNRICSIIGNLLVEVQD